MLYVHVWVRPEVAIPQGKPFAGHYVVEIDEERLEGFSTEDRKALIRVAPWSEENPLGKHHDHCPVEAPTVEGVLNALRGINNTPEAQWRRRMEAHELESLQALLAGWKKNEGDTLRFLLYTLGEKYPPGKRWQVRALFSPEQLPKGTTAEEKLTLRDMLEAAKTAAAIKNEEEANNAAA